ncbi:MAG: MFS transporter [Sphingobium sp.]
MAGIEGTTGAREPQDIIGHERMRGRQILAIAICVLLNALDGFDVLSISFAAPGIANEWGIDRAALGAVLSMELIGMAVGSVLLGQVADRVGRRPVVIGCLVAMAISMYATSLVHDIATLSATRLITGLGIGGMLVCISAMSAEFSSFKWRAASVAIMAAGYPAGAIVGGSIASGLLASGTWRDVFIFGAMATAACLPVVLWLVPESVGYLMQKRPADALARVNRTLAALGHDRVETLPMPVTAPKKASFGDLFSPALRATTILLVVGYFCHIMNFYFMAKWIPKVVADMGFSPSLAGQVLVWMNVGGLIGSLLFSALTLKMGVRGLLTGALLLSAVSVAMFGQGQADLNSLSFVAAVAGFFLTGGIVGLYALTVSSFPAALRGGGTGIVIGVGRGGAALAPALAGLLFEIGLNLQAVAMLAGASSLLAAAVLLMLPRSATLTD